MGRMHYVFEVSVSVRAYVRPSFPGHSRAGLPSTSSFIVFCEFNFATLSTKYVFNFAIRSGVVAVFNKLHHRHITQSKTDAVLWVSVSYRNNLIITQTVLLHEILICD